MQFPSAGIAVVGFTRKYLHLPQLFMLTPYSFLVNPLSLGNKEPTAKSSLVLIAKRTAFWSHPHRLAACDYCTCASSASFLHARSPAPVMPFRLSCSVGLSFAALGALCECGRSLTYQHAPKPETKKPVLMGRLVSEGPNTWPTKPAHHYGLGCVCETLRF